MLKIPSPIPETGWAQGEIIPFVGRANTTLGGLIDYTWTFQDGDSHDCLNVPVGTDCIPSKSYAEPGFYDVELSASDDFGNFDTENVLIYIVNPVSLEFNCSLRYLTCDAGELEMMKQ